MKNLKFILLILVSVITLSSNLSYGAKGPKVSGLKAFFAKSRCKKYFRKKSTQINQVQKSKKYCKMPQVYKTFVGIKLKILKQQFHKETYFANDTSKKPFIDRFGKKIYPQKRMSRTVKTKHSKNQYNYMSFNKCIDRMKSFADKSGEFIIHCSLNKNSYRKVVKKGYIQTCFNNSAFKIGNDLAMNKCVHKNFRGLIKSSKIFTCVDNLLVLDVKMNDSVNFCSDRLRIGASISGQFNSCYQKTKVLNLSAQKHLARCDNYEKIQVVTTFPYIECVEALIPYSIEDKSFNAYTSCEDTRYINRSLMSHYSTCIDKIQDVHQNMNESHRRCATSRLFSATKEKNFKTCTLNVGKFNDSSEAQFNLCDNSVNIFSISSKQYVDCGQKMQTVQVSSDILTEKCVDTNFQDKVNQGHMTTCIRKINSHTNVPNNSLIACQHDSTHEASKKESFYTCLESLDKLNLKPYAINSCTYNHMDFKLINLNQLNRCFERSINSAQGDYFDEIGRVNYFDNLNDTSDSNNPFTKVVKDCSSDLSAKKKINNSKISLIQDFHFSSEHRSKKIKNRLGGLSAITFNHKKNKLYAISDGKNNYDEPTIIKYNLDLKDGKLNIKETGATVLSVNSTWSPDPEGLVRLKDGGFIITTETGLAHENQYINRYDKHGKWLSEIKVPSSFRNKNKKSYSSNNGFQYNKGLEALAISLDENLLVVANEDTLKQDIEYRKSDRVRLTLYKKIRKKLKNGEIKEDYKPHRQYVYPLEKNRGNGLVELLFNEDGTLYSLERGYDSQTGVTARLFKVDLKGATNVLQNNSLKDVKKPLVTVKKEILLDFSHIENSISAGFRKIDNLEGMTFGPTLPNGNKTLIFVSDNNFSSRQLTQFLVFEIKN